PPPVCACALDRPPPPAALQPIVAGAAADGLKLLEAQARRALGLARPDAEELTRAPEVLEGGRGRRDTAGGLGGHLAAHPERARPWDMAVAGWQCVRAAGSNTGFAGATCSRGGSEGPSRPTPIVLPDAGGQRHLDLPVQVGGRHGLNSSDESSRRPPAWSSSFQAPPGER